jgi:hypothetical protein
LAQVLNDLNDTKGERIALEKAVNIDAGFVMAQYQLGYLDSIDGGMTGAEQQYRLATEASPGYVQAWLPYSQNLNLSSANRNDPSVVNLCSGACVWLRNFVK